MANGNRRGLSEHAICRSCHRIPLPVTTPCARNLTRRRRQRQDTWPALMPALTAQNIAVLEACRALDGKARVMDVSFDLALLSVCNWLLWAPVSPPQIAAVLPFPCRPRDHVSHPIVG